MATALSGNQDAKLADVGNDVVPSRSPRRRGGVQLLPLDVNRIASPSRIRHWHAPSDVPADMTGSGTLSTYSLLMSNPFNDNGTIVLPSPFSQADEPARPASDMVRPVSKEDQITADDASPNTGRYGFVEIGEGKRSPEIEYREGT